MNTDFVACGRCHSPFRYIGICDARFVRNFFLLRVRWQGFVHNFLLARVRWQGFVRDFLLARVCWQGFVRHFLPDRARWQGSVRAFLLARVRWQGFVRDFLLARVRWQVVIPNKCCALFGCAIYVIYNFDFWQKSLNLSVQNKPFSPASFTKKMQTTMDVLFY